MYAFSRSVGSGHFFAIIYYFMLSIGTVGLLLFKILNGGSLVFLCGGLCVCIKSKDISKN